MDSKNKVNEPEPTSNAFWQCFWRVIAAIAGIAFGVTLMSLMVQGWKPLWMLLPLVAYAAAAVVAIIAPKGEENEKRDKKD